MPLLSTKGAASAQGFGEFSQPSTANYIEDVFSTYLYIGNGSTQIINNGIDLANMGGMVWLKDRTSANPSWVMDTLRGTASAVQTSSTSAINTSTNIVTAYNANGFSIGANNNSNTSGNNIVSWTFRKQPKFFDVVTYTGTGSARTIAHNLGSAPGCIIVKRTDTTGNWQVYHRSLTSASYSVQLNLTNGQASATTIWNSTAPTSTVFSVGTDATVNASGGTYVAYIFAHNAGGFGLTSTNNIISCGSYTGSGVVGNTIALGYEPQWIMIKRTDSTSSWGMFDNMRGFVSNSTSGSIGALWADQSSAESTGLDNPYITSTGFGLAGNNTNYNASGGTYIYIAIRRPMKTPTSGASVFKPITRTGTGAIAVVTGVGFSPDLALIDTRSDVGGSAIFTDRLRGVQKQLQSASTSHELTPAANGGLFVFGQDGVSIGPNYDAYTNVPSRTYIDWMFSRAPCFFDVVCYTGTGVPGVVNHNLSVVPEMIIVKDRSAFTNWFVYSASLGATKYLYLNQTSASATATTEWNGTPTTTNFTIGTSGSTNTTGNNYVAYLFASCPGVSKVGSYTGNGTTQTINCGFSAGARFILIKRTDSTADWYVWDTARGIVTGNDPRLSLNTTASEVTTDDSVDAGATGFIVNQLTATHDVNVSGGTYIYLAIA